MKPFLSPDKSEHSSVLLSCRSNPYKYFSVHFIIVIFDPYRIVDGKNLEITSMIDPRFKEQCVTDLEEVKENICREAVSLFEVEEAQKNDPITVSIINRELTTGKKAALAFLFKKHATDNTYVSHTDIS